MKHFAMSKTKKAQKLINIFAPLNMVNPVIYKLINSNIFTF